MRIRKLTLAAPAALCATVGGLLLWSAPALAVRAHIFGGTFGSEGTGNGQLAGPAGVAVNEATGDVYVVDKGNNRVQYFTAAGSYLGQFDGSGANLTVEGQAAPTGKFSAPQGVAVDNDPGSPSFGDVYIADDGHEAVDKFSSTGEYIGQLTETSGGSTFGEIVGIAVGSNGDLWVDQTKGFENIIDSFSSAVVNEFLSRRESQASASGAGFGGHTFAVDSNEDLYVKSFFNGITKLNSSGAVLVKEFDSLLKEPGAIEFPGDVAVDLSTNDVYIVDADAENSVALFSSTGALLETFGSEHLSQGSGIAVNSATGDVYVADAAANDVDRFVLEPEARPTIEHEAPTEVAGTSATLTAQLKPTGPDTTYYFQYGTAICAAVPSPCSDLPAAPGLDIGSGFVSQSVSVHVQGLQPGTTYHFRVVAVNELGTSDGAEGLFATQAAGGESVLPDGRSWELVTPPYKQGAGIDGIGNEQGADIQAAADGTAITYAANAPFEANPAGSRTLEVTQVFSARRAPGSWETRDITTAHDEGATPVAVGHSAEYKLFSSDLSLGLTEPEGDTPLPPLPAGAEKTIYLRTASGGYMALVTSGNVPAGTRFGGNGQGAGDVQFVSATPDFSHIVINSAVGLTSTPGDEGGLYEWSAGKLQLVSVLPHKEPTRASLGDRGAIVRHAISDDGSRVVFKANTGERLYMRDVARKETVQVDAAQGAPEPASPQSQYSTASSDGSRVFFTNAQRLTADSTASNGEDLYVFEVTSPKDQPLAGSLKDLTVDANAGESADVRGVIGASEDGSYIYFVANGVLGDGAEHGARKGDCEQTTQAAKQTCNLYVARYDHATNAWAPPVFVATLSGADAPSWGHGGADLTYMTSRVSPNGRYLAFMSDRSLTGYENRDANSGVPDEEVYLYDASAGHVVCASCDPTGARPAGLLEGDRYEENLVDYAKTWGGRWLAANIPGWDSADLGHALYQSRYLSDSGRLFFNSSDALVPGDVNGKEDVYEYEPSGVGTCQGAGHGQNAGVVFSEGADGCVGLISSGTSAEESAFMDASETGGDVFFLTLSRLSPSDNDTSIDLYDAHECAGASPCAPPAALAPPACTTGDACKAAPTPQPAAFGAPASATFSGAGNVTPSSSPAAVTPRSAGRTQKLAKALKACKAKSRRQRAACESRARKRYRAKRARARKSLTSRTGR